MQERPSCPHPRGDQTRWWCAVLCIGATLCLATLAQAQVVPGSAEDFRVRLTQARTCYELVDYGCVIASLEGSLLARAELPDEVSADEVRESYELLGLSFLAVGLADEGRRSFARLLQLDETYRLARPEASPTQLAMVDALREARRLAFVATHQARQVREKAWLIAGLPRISRTTRAVWAGMLAREVSAHVLTTARASVPRLANPPWGPLSAPNIGVSGSWRAMFGSDARAWGSGFGLGTRVALTYRPLEFGLGYWWSRHESLLEDAVIVPPPDLDIHALVADVSWVVALSRLKLRAGAQGGIQLLDVVASLRSLNPSVGAVLGADLTLSSGLSAKLETSFGWVFGHSTVGGSKDLAASPSLMIALGVSFSP